MKTRMNTNRSGAARCRFAALVVLLLFANTFSGCALVQFGSYDSFDDWFVDRKNDFDIEEFGVKGMKKYGHPDYVVNDMVIRTPVYLVYDLTRIPLMVVAIPYYIVRSLTEDEKKSETGQAEPPEPKPVREK